MATQQRLIPGLTAAVLAVVAVAGWAPPAPAQQAGAVQMEWLSWSHFRFTSPGGKVVLTNPFTSNPDSPIKTEEVTRADVIVVADGHRDEIGEAPQIAKRTGAKVVAVRELALGYLAAQGIPQNQLVLAGIGDRFRFDGVTVRVVHSIHGSGVPDPTKPYGGPAAGFMITFEDGLTVYFAGSTAISMDLQIYGSLYKPHVAILPLAGRRDPRDLAHMARLLLTDNPNLKTIIPHHHRLRPPAGAPTVQDLEQEIRALG
ncbi:MAG: MBL fold metallo-hydrolase, partial [Deltaproteobacteria bacterium]|nr:MBL fold metallo-hydrolase [Deltaproteobacteria bacterium]